MLRLFLACAAAHATVAYCVSRPVGVARSRWITTPRTPALALCSPLPPLVATRLALSDSAAAEEIRAIAPEELAELTSALQQAVGDAGPLSFSGDATRLSRMLAVALARSGEIELSELSARAVLASTPVDAAMLFLLGVACEARDELDEALDAYEKALEAEPDHWRTLFHLGKLALSIGLQPQARDYFGQVLEINPAHAATARILDKFQEFDELEVQQVRRCAVATLRHVPRTAWRQA